jgi:hypothetical protein
VEDILEVMKDRNAFLGTGGHLSIPELVDRAKTMGIKVLVNSVSTDKLKIALGPQKKWAGDHVFMEHTYMAVTEATPIGTVLEQIRGVGAEYCMLATDAGGMQLPDNATVMRRFVEELLASGITEKEIDVMTRKNPKMLLGVS